MAEIVIENLDLETNLSELDLLEQDRVIGGRNIFDTISSITGINNISIVGDITIGDIRENLGNILELELNGPFTPPTFPN